MSRVVSTPKRILIGVMVLGTLDNTDSVSPPDRPSRVESSLMHGFG